MVRSFLIKYAEIGVKGKNRYIFEDKLTSHIHHSLKRLDGDFSVIMSRDGFMLMHLRSSTMMRWYRLFSVCSELPASVRWCR